MHDLSGQSVTAGGGDTAFYNVLESKEKPKGLTVDVRILDLEKFKEFCGAVLEAIDDPRVPDGVKVKIWEAAERLTGGRNDA